MSGEEATALARLRCRIHDAMDAEKAQAHKAAAQRMYSLASHHASKIDGMAEALKLISAMEAGR